VQAKRIHNILNKIITEKFPNLKKEMSIQVQQASRTPNRHDENRATPWYIIIKTTSTENKEKNTDLPCPWIGQINIMKMDILPKLSTCSL
jgi:hypothetical protein